MRITRVELDNIKSYRRASIPLAGGTVAIRGHNGAGKSTLVEAIGFALFDALGYSQEQFVREGERSGTVTVTFISALDDREYQVVRRCGSSASWYVHDPEIGGRVVEQRQDVLDFLRRHLRIETDIKLADLFTDALGVPQGTFTADFLLTPANRKKKFDTLLQVEEYRKAAERLNETKNYLIEQRHGVEMHIANLERETGQLNGWREQLDAAIQREREIVEHLRQIQVEAAQVEARLTALRAQQAEVTRLASEAQIAEAAAVAVEGRLRDAETQLAEARESVAICAAARPDHAALLGAHGRLAAAPARASERDDLARLRASVAQQHEGAGRDLHHAHTRLTEAREAVQRLADLTPAVTRQGELEVAREVANREMSELEAARRALRTAERDLAQVAGEIAEAERQIADLEALRPEAALLDERRERVSMLQDVRAKRTEKQKRLDALALELRRAEVDRAAAAKAEASAQAWVTRITENAALAEELPALETRAEGIEHELRRIEARMEQHRLSREQSGAGNCPFLREPCLNIRAKGM
ncbi:MAG: AAA family ATPase, partial [Ktedonobacterales bacterium]